MPPASSGVDVILQYPFALAFGPKEAIGTSSRRIHGADHISYRPFDLVCVF